MNQAKKFSKKSIDELKKIARLKNIKTIEQLTKKELIITLLKSESTTAELNFEKRLNDNNNENNNTDDDTYNNRIRNKMCDIRIILNRLRNIVKDRKEIKKKIYETEKKENLSDNEREENYDYLVKKIRTLDNKEKYKYHDRDDLDYFGIRDIENLFGNIDDDYCKPTLISSSFNGN